MSPHSILITDLDGTLTDFHNRISSQSIETLRKLKDANVLRVIATGRNLFSSRKILTPDLPFDYLIFSGGVGILDWRDSRLLFTSELNRDETRSVTEWLKQEDLDFMIQAPLPENHLFEYRQGSRDNSDFKKRCELYSPYCKPWREEDIPAASQVIVVEPSASGARVFEATKAKFPELSVVRTTSPLDKTSVWIEVSASGISKASAAEWLCRRLSIDPKRSIGIGNDYNDTDLLNWVAEPYIMEDSPQELKAKYTIVPAAEKEGFTAAVKMASSLLQTR